MKQLKFSLIIIGFLFLSCNSSTTTDEKFLGTWVFSNTVPESSSNDGSMDGSTCKITKVDGSKESYSVDIGKYEGILFSKEDENTLKGVDGAFEIRYDESKEHIKFLMSPSSGEEYYKLK